MFGKKAREKKKKQRCLHNGLVNSSKLFETKNLRYDTWKEAPESPICKSH
jgi:hypothetical protein